ncbi:hypothetical protein PINS_up016279 [Pythium insidiosum]|nr:hypothetical protein PINS_up016279 [Pythium insidiosum]
MQQRQDPSLRREFYMLCKEHLASRDGGGYITSQAFRLLLKNVKGYMLKLPLLQRKLEAVTRKVLDKYSCYCTHASPRRLLALSIPRLCGFRKKIGGQWPCN